MLTIVAFEANRNSEGEELPKTLRTETTNVTWHKSRQSEKVSVSERCVDTGGPGYGGERVGDRLRPRSVSRLVPPLAGRDAVPTPRHR